MNNHPNVILQPGLGLGPILFLIFMTLKLVGSITWSWWWVTAPLWIPFGLVFICILIWGILMALGGTGN